MRAAYTPLAATVLLLAACKDQAAPTSQSAPSHKSDVPAEIANAPGMKERGDAQPVQHSALPVSRAEKKLPRNPFTVLRTPAELEHHWRLAGGIGAPPKVDFSRAAVISLRLPASSDAARMAPHIYSIQKGTHVLLRDGTPRELGGQSTDRIHYYEVATGAGPVASVRYPSAP
jgi:hypothetical protein